MNLDTNVNKNIVVFFLLQKVQLEDKTDEGYTALTAASANGRLRVIKELIRSDFKKNFL